MSKRSPLSRPSVALAASLTVLAAAPVAAQGTSEQRAACTGDAMRLCLSAVPDVGRITACMKSHYGDLSPRCQATFNEGSGAAPPRKLAEEPAKPVEKKPVENKQAESKPAERKPAESKQAEGKQAESRRVQAKVESRRGERQQAAARRETPRGETAATPSRERATAHLAAPRRNREVAEAAASEAPRRDLAGREPPVRQPTPRIAAKSLPSERFPPYPDIGGAAGTAPPRPQLAAGLSASAGNLAVACREGLIDPYTCGHTIPSLGLGE